MNTIDIVFDGPPSHEAPRFVEVERPPGTSIKFGEWVHRDDGYWVLRIPDPERPMTKLFVLCTNDYPYKVLPLGTTAEQAEACRARLNAIEEEREKDPMARRGGRRRIFYHVHELDVEEPGLIQEYGS